MESIAIHHNKLSLSEPQVKKALDDLHDKFVITPVDKANGNIAVICKRYYAEVLAKELGLKGHMNANQTYCEITNKSSNDLINQHLKDLDSEFKIKNITPDNECLPKIYWIPKKHKIPSKARFIIASPKCSIKTLSKYITSVFKLFYKQIESYNKKCEYFSGVKSFWVVQNNKPVIDAIHKLNHRNKASSIATFDFSTLYTKIPHDKLINVLNILTDFCFNAGDKRYLKITIWCYMG